jgi:transcriptional regulator with XRE-family HTH domain
MSDERINGALVRAMREAKGMGQVELAAAAGTSQAVISRLEQGLQSNFKLGPVARVARVLGTTVDALLVSSGQVNTSALEPELAAALAHLAILPPVYQRQLAALIQTYIATVPHESFTE